MPKSMDDGFTTHSGKDPKWEQFATRYKWKKGWQRLRLFGLVYQDARHNNITTKGGKAYSEFCHGFDVANDTYFRDREARCEVCRLGIPAQVRYFINVFDLDAWEKRPANQTPDWNPISLADIPPSLMRSIIDLKPLNHNFLVGDTLKGAIINVHYNPDSQSPSEMYKVSLDTKGWVFEPDMCKFTFTQETPEGKRELRKGTESLPPQWVYYPCRSSRENMISSLRRNGHYDKAGDGQEVSDAVSAKAKALAADIGQLVDEQPRTSVRELAKLHEEVPPPPKPKKVEAEITADDTLDIPF